MATEQETLRVNLEAGRDTLTPAMANLGQQTARLQSNVRGGLSQSIRGFREETSRALPAVAEFAGSLGSMGAASGGATGGILRIVSGITRLNPLLVAGTAAAALFGDEIAGFVDRAAETAIDGLSRAFSALNEELTVGRPELDGWNNSLAISVGLVQQYQEGLTGATLIIGEFATALGILADAGPESIFADLQEQLATAAITPFDPETIFSPEFFPEPEPRQPTRRGDARDRALELIIERKDLEDRARADEEAAIVEHNDRVLELQIERKELERQILEDALAEEAELREQQLQRQRELATEAAEAEAIAAKARIDAIVPAARALGDFTGVFAQNERARAIIKAAVEAAEIASAIARFDPLSAALHGIALAKWIAVAARAGGGGGAGGAGTATTPAAGGGIAAFNAPPPRTDRDARLREGQRAGPLIININAPIREAYQTGRDIGDSLNRTAQLNSGFVLDPRLLPPGVFGG